MYQQNLLSVSIIIDLSFINYPTIKRWRPNQEQTMMMLLYPMLLMKHKMLAKSHTLQHQSILSRHSLRPRRSLPRRRARKRLVSKSIFIVSFYDFGAKVDKFQSNVFIYYMFVFDRYTTCWLQTVKRICLTQTQSPRTS